MASHDEETIEDRNYYHHLGCRICEFPVNKITAMEAVRLHDSIVFGAPNVLKGGSIYNRTSAREMIAEGLCHILASDYFYPSQLESVFLLDMEGVMPIELGWDLISGNVADALHLSDRGRIQEGKRADLVIVSCQGQNPEIIATIVKGNIVYLSDLNRIRNVPERELMYSK